jgi:hypothetical protein
VQFYATKSDQCSARLPGQLRTAACPKSKSPIFTNK